MKKSLKTLFKILICFIIILPISFASVACSNGKSAYELAVENGFVGTLDEWLASLKGTNGSNGKDKQSETSYQMWEKAKQEGSFTGTYLEFLETYFLYDDATFATNKALSSIVEITTNSKAGSGVIYSIDNDYNAFIITNYHVIYGYSSCTVKLYGTNESKKFNASIVGGSETYDIAVLYLENCSMLEYAKATPATFNLDTPQPGSTCIAIGNTNNEGINVTKGCIRKESEDHFFAPVSNSSNHRFIGHDAFITNGNSGGGLFNVYGELIGITNGGLTSTSSVDNSQMKLAIPASIVYSVTENIISNCFRKINNKVVLANLGLNFTSSATRQQNPTSGLTETIDVVTISTISSTSDLSSLQIDDRLISFKITTQDETLEKEVKRYFDLEDYLPLITENCQIELTFTRTGEAKPLKVTLNYNNLSHNQIV